MRSHGFLYLVWIVSALIPAAGDEEVDGSDADDEAFLLDLPFDSLERAAKNASANAVLDLLQLGQSSLTPEFDVHYANEDGFSPLYWSSWSGCAECVDLMLQAGADVNQAGNDGATPLIAAAASNHSAVCSRLLAAGADLHAQRRTVDGERSALDYARERHYHECVAVLEDAIEQDAKKHTNKKKKKKKAKHKKKQKTKKPKSKGT